MTSPISSGNAIPQPAYQQSQRPQPGSPAAASSPEDTVKLSQKATAAAQSGDVDHDGDSH